MSEEEIRILKEKIQEQDKRITEIEKLLTIKKEIPFTEGKTEIQKLSTKLGVPADRFNEIFDKEENILTVIKHIGVNDKEKTQSITLLTLFGYKTFFGYDETLSQEIRRNVAENSISLNNFSTYINELVPSLLRRKGELKSPKTTYRLTISGEVKAKEIVKKILGG